MSKVSKQSRLSIWRTRQNETRKALGDNPRIDDGIVASALEEEVMRLLGIHPHPIWEARYDGWLPLGLMSPDAAAVIGPETRPPRPGRRVEIKALRDGATGRRISIDLAQCDDLVLVRWHWTTTPPYAISAELRYIRDIATAFGLRPIRRTNFGVAQIIASSAPVVPFSFR